MKYCGTCCPKYGRCTAPDFGAHSSTEPGGSEQFQWPLEGGTSAAAISDPGGGHWFPLPGSAPGQGEVPQHLSLRRPGPSFLLKAANFQVSSPRPPTSLSPELRLHACSTDRGLRVWASDGSGFEPGFTSRLATYAAFVIVPTSLLLLLKLCLRSLCNETLQSLPAGEMK